MNFMLFALIPILNTLGLSKALLCTHEVWGKASKQRKYVSAAIKSMFHQFIVVITTENKIYSRFQQQVRCWAISYQQSLRQTLPVNPDRVCASVGLV